MGGQARATILAIAAGALTVIPPMPAMDGDGAGLACNPPPCPPPLRGRGSGGVGGRSSEQPKRRRTKCLQTRSSNFPSPRRTPCCGVAFVVPIRTARRRPTRHPWAMTWWSPRAESCPNHDFTILTRCTQTVAALLACRDAGTNVAALRRSHST